MDIIHKSILIATSVVVLVTTIISCFADDFWNKLLTAAANIAFGALIAIACQFVKPIMKLFNFNSDRID